VLVGGCRRNQPSLVDRNQAPETQLWYAPPDSSDYEYLVHLYWRGTDSDGIAERFIWTIQDTLVTDETAWNPAERLRDFRSGRMITRTDSVFSFTAFKVINGVGVKKNRQAFYIAAIDDNGVIDPTPAAVEFVATIDELPQIFFTLYIDGRTIPYMHRPTPRDTVGMAKPFQISYHGETTNGEVRAYQWFPLSTTVELPGARIWSTNLSDTLRSFTNAGEQTLPSSVFRFAAKCIDDADAESPVDAGRFQEGVAQVVVNFDPDTEIDGMKSYYFKNGAVQPVRDIDFADGVPDTVPYRSWLWIHYASWDDEGDVIRCSPLNNDRCINFQIKYERSSSRLRGGFGSSGWTPRGAAHDTDTLSAADSNTVNIGTVEYNFFVRGIDENLRPDGTPARVRVIGNYDPTLTSVTFQDHLGNEVDINSGAVDTLTWNFWKGVGWPYTSGFDTLDIFDPELRFFKRFQWRLSATGFDHPDDPDGSAIKTWRYLIFDDENNFWPLARAGETWVTGDALNSLDDTFELTFRYPSCNTDPDDPTLADPCGDTVFANLPAFLNRDLTLYLTGRDTGVDEGEFSQFMFYSTVAPNAKGSHGRAEKVLINSYPTAVYGRWTEEKVFTFHFRMIRDPEPPAHQPGDCNCN
jgi:hypothetical protein